MVSASDGDESVHGAVQSLVRYLIERTLPPRQKRKKARQRIKNVKKKRKGEDEGEGLIIYCGKEEVTNTCNPPKIKIV